jgi:glycosyltransferase involved in cell wall biosynthesis
MPKKYSVIIPAFNASGTIARCLQALEDQSLPKKEYEVLVVDDGSSDQTSVVAKRFPVRYFWQPNQGPAAARNRGASEAAGAIILFTDADCIPDHNWIEEMVKPFADYQVMAVKGAYKTEQKALTARFAQVEFEERYGMLRKAYSIDMVDTYSAAFRKIVFLSLGGFDPVFPVANNEDTDFSYRMSMAGHRMIFQPMAVVQHLHHPDTIQKYAKLKFWRGYWRMVVYKRYPGKMFRDTYTPQTLKLQIVFLFLSFMSLALWGMRPGHLVYPFLLSVSSFCLFGLPLTILALKRDPVIGLFALFFIALRAGSLGLGILWGALSWLKK